MTTTTTDALDAAIDRLAYTIRNNRRATPAWLAARRAELLRLTLRRAQIRAKCAASTRS